MLHRRLLAALVVAGAWNVAPAADLDWTGAYRLYAEELAGYRFGVAEKRDFARACRLADEAYQGFVSGRPMTALRDRARAGVLASNWFFLAYSGPPIDPARQQASQEAFDRWSVVVEEPGAAAFPELALLRYRRTQMELRRRGQVPVWPPSPVDHRAEFEPVLEGLRKGRAYFDLQRGSALVFGEIWWRQRAVAARAPVPSRSWLGRDTGWAAFPGATYTTGGLPPEVAAATLWAGELPLRVLTEFDLIHGPDMPRRAVLGHVWTELARMQRTAKELDASWESRVEALEEYERVLGADHPLSLAIRYETARDAGRLAPERAVVTFAPVLAHVERQLGYEHPARAGLLVVLADLCLAAGARDLAVDNLVRAVASGSGEVPRDPARQTYLRDLRRAFQMRGRIDLDALGYTVARRKLAELEELDGSEVERTGSGQEAARRRARTAKLRERHWSGYTGLDGVRHPDERLAERDRTRDLPGK